jgi:tripartite-type tricarboxylate transporter receptor subunit TctC
MKLSRRRCLDLALGAATLPLLPQRASALDYPTRPVRLIVGFPAGSSSDLTARLIAERLGQPFAVENRTGAGTNIATESVAHAERDGYTLLWVTHANAFNATLYDHLDFNFIRDIQPVASVLRVPAVMEVTPSVPAKTVPEFIAYLRANPGKLNHASNSATTMLTSELFKARAKVDYVDVNYRGASQAIVSTQSGTTQFCFVDLGSGMSAIEGKTLHALGLTSPTRYELAPDIAAIAEQGLPGYSASSMTLLLAPANVPAEIIEKINGAFQDARRSPEVIKKLHAMGQAVSNESLDEAAQALRSEAQQWKQLIAERHIQFGR